LVVEERVEEEQEQVEHEVIISRQRNQLKRARKHIGIID
jgi:hypothetical protein